jgi:tocopherol O-methyltransferase
MRKQRCQNLIAACQSVGSKARILLVIIPKQSINVAEVVSHYDELDVFYREIWGEHVHHGLWRSGEETSEQATLALVDHVAELARIGPDNAVCDIGSGYGAAARYLARHYGVQVTALTVTPKQHHFALSVEPTDNNPIYLLRDWNVNGLSSASFDAAIAIESLSHMSDKRHALAEAARVLKPGGRLVLCVWLASNYPSRWVSPYLLEPICRQGRLPGLATETDYRSLLEATGFKIDDFENVSRQVRRTWAICIIRVLKTVSRDRKYRRFLLDSKMRNREFFLAMFRILVAYAVGAMRYGIFAAYKT